MSTNFSRTSRALRADAFTSSLLRLALVTLLVAAWAAWFVFAHVTTYVTTDAARLEVDRAAHSLESVVGGAVLSHQLAVGREVKEGDVLVELDASQPRLELDRERTRHEGLKAELVALASLLDAEANVTVKESAAATASLAEARARVREADGAARFAEDEERRTAKLRVDGTVSELEMARAHSEAVKLRAAADALVERASRIERESEQHVGERDARARELERDRVRLQGELATSAATMELITRRVADCSVRAPVSGVLGEVSALSVGTVVVAGEKLGAVIPAGELCVVAHFAPASSLGRLKPGQGAEVRLDAFPWAQYGTLAATVRTVASEVRDGTIRVALDPAHGAFDRLGSIKLEHGLTGSVEVAVERATPAQLVIRFMGQLLRSRPDPAKS